MAHEILEHEEEVMEKQKDEEWARRTVNSFIDACVKAQRNPHLIPQLINELQVKLPFLIEAAMITAKESFKALWKEFLYEYYNLLRIYSAFVEGMRYGAVTGKTETS